MNHAKFKTLLRVLPFCVMLFCADLCYAAAKSYTEFFVTKESSISDLNAGCGQMGAHDGPIETAANCTVDGGSTSVITNNDGAWAHAQADDWLVWDIITLREHRRIVSVDGANITVNAAMTPAAGKTVRIGGAWEHIDHAASTITTSSVNADGDPPRVNIKVGIYAEAVTIDNAGSHSCVITYQGYNDDPGDAKETAPAIIDGQDSHGCIADGISGNANLIFANIRCTRSSGSGFALDACDVVRFDYCVADNNASNGFWADDDAVAIGCTAFANVAGKGIDFDRHGLVVGGTFTGSDGGSCCIEVFNGVIVDALIIANNTTAVFFKQILSEISLLLNCTIDGNATKHGVTFTPYTSYPRKAVVVNNIFYDCNTGINAAANMEKSMAFGRNNLFYSCTKDHDNWYDGEGDITGQDPLFVDAANGDYRLQSRSPARRAAWPSYLDIGALQFNDAGRGPRPWRFGR